MARKSKADRMSELHGLALLQFDESYIATKYDREMAQVARRFVMIRGEQWSWDSENQFRNKVKMEVDHISGAITRIVNEWRKNKISATFMPKDGSNADRLADACAGRYRADTNDTAGREARAVAFDCSVNGGYGGIRLRTELEDGHDKHQRICMEPINDPESCLYFDVNAKRKDKSDAEHAFLVIPWSRRAYIKEYGEDGSSWPASLRNTYQFRWYGENNDIVQVAEYFVKEDYTETYRIFVNADGDTEEMCEDDAEEKFGKIEEWLATGYVEQAPEQRREKRVAKYVLNGMRVLSGPEIIAGPNIPLVPQYGHRTVINHTERFRGHVIKSMDSQIIYNLQVSKVAETAASSGIEKPIFTPEQVGRHANMWKNDHIDNNAYLLIDPITGLDGQPQPIGAIGFTKSPEVAPAVAALINLTKQDIADQLGNPENAEQLQPDQSGVALDLVQGRIDMQSYGYMDEAGDTERRCAEIWMGMAAEIYVDEGRKLKTVDKDGRRGQIVLGRKIQDKMTGKPINEIDFSKAAYDVITDIGPTSASRRAAVVRTVASILGVTADPDTQMMLTHVALTNMEGEGLEGVREYSRKKLVAMGVEKPTPEEEEEMMAAAQQPEPEDPNAVLAKAMAAEAEAKATKALADTELAQAKTEETQAKTAETLAGIPLAQRKAAVETAKAIMDQIQDPQQ
jgi:hypothetical protein